MSENEMDNRGSKSVILNNIAVKEQRVDGSWCNENTLHLRYTLKGFERNYQIRIPSNQINKIIYLHDKSDCLVIYSNRYIWIW